MNILICQEPNLGLRLDSICLGLGRILRPVQFKSLPSIVLPGRIINRDTYDRLPEIVVQSARTADLILIASSKRYDNNFFFDSDHQEVVIISLANWALLTRISQETGFTFFLAELLAHEIRLGLSHNESHCCPRQDRVVPRFAESKGLESAATRISD